MLTTMMYPAMWYADFHHWWYNSLGVSKHFMTVIPDIWRGRVLYSHINHWFDGTMYLLASTSGNFISMIRGDVIETDGNLYGIIICTMIIGIILDYLILSEISDFYKRRNIVKSHNKIFVYFYVLWRVIMPDIFVVSTLSALGCKITLSRKNVFLLAILAQVLRFIFIVILWYIFTRV